MPSSAKPTTVASKPTTKSAGSAPTAPAAPPKPQVATEPASHTPDEKTLIYEVLGVPEQQFLEKFCVDMEKNNYSPLVTNAITQRFTGILMHQMNPQENLPDLMVAESMELAKTAIKSLKPRQRIVSAEIFREAARRIGLSSFTDKVDRIVFLADHFYVSPVPTQWNEKQQYATIIGGLARVQPESFEEIISKFADRQSMEERVLPEKTYYYVAHHILRWVPTALRSFVELYMHNKDGTAPHDSRKNFVCELLSTDYIHKIEYVILFLTYDISPILNVKHERYVTSALHRAFLVDASDTFEHLLRIGADTKYDDPPIPEKRAQNFILADKGPLEKKKRYLGILMNHVPPLPLFEGKRTPLYFVKETGDVELFKFFLDTYIMKWEANTVLEVAKLFLVAENAVEYIRLIDKSIETRNPVDRHSFRKNLMYLAVTFNKTDVVKAMIYNYDKETGMWDNYISRNYLYGISMLGLAAYLGDLPMTQMLIAYGYSPVISDQNGLRPYDVALMQGKAEVVEFYEGIFNRQTSDMSRRAALVPYAKIHEELCLKKQ